MIIGILGGGQLSRMLALAGKPLGLDFVFYEPNREHSVKNLGDIITAEYTDQVRLKEFAEKVNVITYENENIPKETLLHLIPYCPVFPNIEALTVSQDRLVEKNFFQTLQIPTTRYLPVNTKEDLLTAIEELKFPLLLKKRSFGYDGKGQWLIKNQEDFEQIATANCQHAIAEAFLQFDREFSLISVSDANGLIHFYDVNENEHRHGILRRTINRINDPCFERAKGYLTHIVERLGYVGILTVEFFQRGNALIANEMAPRVHNSGHWTIEGAKTSQFENHLRSILQWPMGSTKSLGYATLYNLLGEIPNKESLLKDPELHLHDYQKEPRPNRKVGHITLLAQHSHRFLPEYEKLLTV